MKSMNSATPASRDPGPSSLGMIISESLTTIGYSSAKKNCGVYVALLICSTPFAAACTGSQANAHLLNPANPAATEAVAKILNSSRRSIPCPAITHPPFAAINPSPRSCAGAAPLCPMSGLFLELSVPSRPETGERSQSQPATKNVSHAHPRYFTLSSINFFVGPYGSPLPLYSIEQYPRYRLAFKIPNVFAKSIG